MKRIDALLSALDNLNRCFDDQKKATTQEDRVAIFLGEMDWYRELHRLLYEEN